MSCYITIKKKGVTLCCYNRNTEFYKALSGRPEERWTEIRIEDLDTALSNLKDDMKGYEKAISRYEKSLEFLRDAEAVHETLSSIESLEETSKKQIPGSISFVPSVAGLIIAGEVVKDLIG